MAARGGIGGIIGGLVFGVILFFGSFVLHWWNEGNAVKQFGTIGDLERNTVEATADRVDPADEGRPVHLSAQARTSESLEDEKFGVSRVALRLRRTVEMFQWKEEEKEDSNDNKYYEYSKIWSERLIDSSRFHEDGHDNPKAMPFASRSWMAEEVRLGLAYRLPEFLLEDLDHFEELGPIAELPSIPGLKSTSEGFYLGAHPDSPAIGDLRISFAVVPPGPVSLIAAQSGDSFAPWTSHRTGRSIHKIMPGTHSKEAVIQRLETEARLFLWGLRFGGFLLMFFGLLLLSSPLTAAARFVPVLGTVVNTGVAVIGLLVAGILSLLTITIAWISHRPLFGAVLLGAVVVLGFLLAKRLSQQKRPAVG